MRRLLCVILLIASVGATAASPPEAVERTDLLPQHVRWQTYPSDVIGVRIDRQGRPWFELDGNATIEQVKGQVEKAMTLKAPWVRGARIVLFDSAGRVWICPRPGLLLGFDPNSREWIEREATGDRGSDPSSTATSDAAFGPAIEDRDGRIFVGDRGGCHVFDHGRWSYQPFYQLNIAKDLYFGDAHRFEAPTFAQDARGRVYAWAPWGRGGCTGTLGFWVHEQDRWEQVMTEVGQKPGHVAAVVPLGAEQVLVCPESGVVCLMRVDLDDPTDAERIGRDIELLGADDFHQRREAERQIIARGPHVLPKLREALSATRSPEQRARLQQAISVLERKPIEPRINEFRLANARYWGRDARGGIALWADTVGPDGRAGRTAAWIVNPPDDVEPAPEAITDWTPQSMLLDSKGRLFLAHYKNGLAVLQSQKLARITDDSDLPFDTIVGEDHDGRVYVQSRCQVVAIDLDAPDTRRTLPVAAFELSSNRDMACLDCDGRTLAKLLGPSHSFLRRFEVGEWRDLPTPRTPGALEDFTYFQPLRGGGMVVEEQPGGRSYYFDGVDWSEYAGLHELIARNYDALVKRLDNARRGMDAYTKLRLGAGNAIWCVEWGRLAAYDGRRWLSCSGEDLHGLNLAAVRGCTALPDGRRVALWDGQAAYLAETNAAGISVLPLQKPPAATELHGIPWLDSRNRLWLPRSLDSAAVVDHGHTEVLPDTGLPRLEDSAGRVWFVNAADKKLVVIGPEAQRMEWRDEAITDQTTVIENKGSYWFNTTRGLRHVVVVALALLTLKGDGAAYERGIPKGPCDGMWIDRDGALWFCTPGRLYRIELGE